MDDDPVIRKAVYITVFRGKVYLPTLLRFPGKYGGFDESEPVIVAEMRKEPLLASMQQIVAHEYPMRSELTPNEMRQREKDHPLLRATGAINWKSLDRNSISYSINWLQDGVELYASRPRSGEWDESRTRKYSLHVTLEQIVEAVLNDYRSRGIWRWLR